jgi:hypothetical protein
MEAKGVSINEGTILWALRSQLAHGNEDSAYKLLLALSDASEGIVANYDPVIKMKGAQNRQGVTCYLDSTLFSMFSRLDSFEAMLYNTFNDLPRSRLSFLLRVWVNLLRTGQLITTDITRIIQFAIADCGWEEAAELCQHDASEAFTFITGKLELPLLTLKMDIFHTGKEDEKDDHKFINERLLDVAIPEGANGQHTDITLEDCLEAYFNNRIEVRRYLERRSTMNSVKSPVDADSKSPIDGKGKGDAVHVETVEVGEDSSPATPIVSHSLPTQTFPPRPGVKRRSQSIIQERYVPARSESGYGILAHTNTSESTRSRAGSIRKEVMMPAWQFFSLIPWYTDHAPSSDAQVAAHFSSKRPVLGLCLKRYAFHDGRPIRLDTYVDIPIEIALPHFVQDEQMSEGAAPFGNFKLSLQSVVCHRGNSVSSGHYVALVRGTDPTNDSSYWLRFDDLANERITLIDIDKALREETPYLLFYQITPVEGDPGQITAGENSSVTSFGEPRSAALGVSTGSLPLSKASTNNERPSFEITAPDDKRGRSPNEERRPSAISFTDAVLAVSKGSSRNPSPGKSSHSRSGSETLSNSKAMLGIGRSLSKRLKKRISQDVSAEVKSADPVAHDPPPPEVQVREVYDLESQPSVVDKPHPLPAATMPLRPNPGHQHQHQNQQPPQQQIHHAATTPYGHGHGHKRDRSKNRSSKHGKEKARDHPDRECVVM